MDTAKFDKTIFATYLLLEVSLHAKAGFLEKVVLRETPYIVDANTPCKAAKQKLMENALLQTFTEFNALNYKAGCIYKKTWAIYRQLDLEYRQYKRRANNSSATPRFHKIWVNTDELATIMLNNVWDEDLVITVLNSRYPEKEFALYDYNKSTGEIGVYYNNQFTWWQPWDLLYVKMVGHNCVKVINVE